MLPVPAWHYATCLTWSEELPNWAFVPYGLTKFWVTHRNSLELPPCDSREDTSEGWAALFWGRRVTREPSLRGREGSWYTCSCSRQSFHCYEVTPKPLPSPPRSVPLPFQKPHLTRLGPHSLTTSPMLVCRWFVRAARCLNSLGKGEVPKEMDSAVLILSSSFHCLPQP